MHKFLIGGLLAAAAIPALAQVAPVAPVAPAPPVARTGPMADGVMTRAEVQALVQTHFGMMDSNHDGVIAGDELKPRGAWMREGPDGQRKQIMIRREGGPDMAQADGVHIMRDGGPGEHGDPAKMFDRLDTNHDGMINRDEFAKGHQIRIEKRIVMGGPEGAGAPGQPMRFKMRHMGMGGGRMIKMADVNKDGRITLQEATSSALQHFDAADTNRDGRLTIEEMRAAHQNMGLRKAG